MAQKDGVLQMAGQNGHGVDLVREVLAESHGRIEITIRVLVQADDPNVLREVAEMMAAKS